MITVYSEKESTQNISAADCIIKPLDGSLQTKEEINSEIQVNLKVFESVDWSELCTNDFRDV